MKNPYIFGFWCLVVSLVLLFSVVIYSSTLVTPKWTTWLVSANSVATIVQALTSIALVVFAVVGLNQWKRQIEHEKKINTIWAVMAAIHRVDVGFQNIVTELLILGVKQDFEVTVFLQERPLGGYLSELEEHCVWMDRVVTDSEWEWVNHAATLRALVVSYLAQYRSTPPCESLIFPSVMASRQEDLRKALENFTQEKEQMAAKLKHLKCLLGR